MALVQGNRPTSREKLSKTEWDEAETKNQFLMGLDYLHLKAAAEKNPEMKFHILISAVCRQQLRLAKWREMSKKKSSSGHRVPKGSREHGIVLP